MNGGTTEERNPAVKLRIAIVVVFTGLMLLVGWMVSPNRELPPCPTEDSVNCQWDAEQQGNGEGRSFTVDSDGNIEYK